MIIMKQTFKKEKGFVMMVTMVLLVVLTVLGLGAITMSGFQMDISSAVSSRSSSFQCAETGRLLLLSQFEITSPSTQLNTAVKGLCGKIFSGHMPSGIKEIKRMLPLTEGGATGVMFCGNSIGCVNSSGNNYLVTVVGENYKGQQTEIEFIVNVIL